MDLGFRKFWFLGNLFQFPEILVSRKVHDFPGNFYSASYAFVGLQNGLCIVQIRLKSSCIIMTQSRDRPVSPDV